MEAKFEFNKITDIDLDKYVSDSNVFNMSEHDILNERIIVTSFSDETLGSAEEHLDIALFNNGKWDLLDVNDKVNTDEEITLGNLISGLEFTRVLIIIRRMSTIVLDRKKEGVNSYILCKVPEKYKDVSKDKALFGLLAKSHVYLDCTEEEIKNQIQENIFSRNEEICRRLFA